MADLSEMPTKVGGVIPNFFFDAIGRIVPGTYLLVGMLSVRYASSIKSFVNQNTEVKVTNAILVSFCLLFVGYISGFLLGGVSYLLFELMLSRWKRLKWSLNRLRERLGVSVTTQSHLEKVFRERFGFEIADDDKKIEACSWLCVFVVWGENPRLGSMSGRWDAEALASRSIALASLVIALEMLVCFRLSHWGYTLGCLSACVTAICSYYQYHRKNRIIGRFRLFASLPSNTARPSSADDDTFY